MARERIHSGRPVTDVYMDVLEPSQREGGRLWETNRITVAQEHMATAVTQYVMAQLCPEIERAAKPRGSAIVTGVEGELHQIGGHMVADCLEADGWDVRFLGTNLPRSGVLQAVADARARLVGISATMLFNLGSVRALIEGLHALPADARPDVIVGGGLFRWVPGLWREAGADGFATDLRGALQAVREATSR